MEAADRADPASVDRPNDSARSSSARCCHRPRRRRWPIGNHHIGGSPPGCRDVASRQEAEMNNPHQLSRAQLRELEGELRSERSRLERSIATRMGADDAAPTPGSIPQEGTQAEGGLAVALETRIFDRHQMLDSALRRLEEGTYGVCVS